ncbi:RNA polymerase sigma factor [Sphingomonas hankookensis]|uniref:RNA polymerase sigma factor n=1 Tax=Sphingomonas hankookensis TaxID=563996 RepID=UPI001F56378F
MTEREALAEWVGREILPHERDLRGWLRRRLVPSVDVEDIVQECYCRLAQLRSIDDIASPRAYFFTMARNLAHRQRRHARVVRIESISAAETDGLASDSPLQDRVAAARQEVDRVQRALATLSDRARRIFVMRRVEGLSQKEIAAALGVTEMVVENDASRSLRAILRQLTDEDADMADSARTGGDRARAR